jgi:hypothetical protein
VCGHEDDERQRHTRALCLLEHGEAIDLRHLYVEDHQVRMEIANRGNRRGTAERFGNDLHILMTREHGAEARESRWLIVDGHDTE